VKNAELSHQRRHTLKSLQTDQNEFSFQTDTTLADTDGMERILPILLALLFIVQSAAAESLSEAWEIATQVNYRLRAESHQVAAARADLQAAKAHRLPSVTNRTSYVTLSEPPTGLVGIPPIPILFPSGTHIELPLCDPSFATSSTTATVPLFTGGKITSSIEAHRHQVRAAHAGYAASFQEIKGEVTESYFNVLRARQLLNVAKTAEKSAFRHQSDAEKMLRQKLVTRNVLLAAQTAKAAATQDVLKTENLVLAAEAAYNRYMGRPLDSVVLIEEISVPPISGELTSLTEEACRNRRELSQIASKSQASSAMSRVSHADRLPMVVASGGHSYMENSHTKQESFWMGSLSLQWTPLDGGVSRARERSAAENAAAAARQRDEVRSLIELQVRTAWYAEQETRSRLEVTQLGFQQATENLRVVTRQFQEGLVNHSEVLDTQTLRTAAATNHCNAIYDAILATYRLKRAVGIL
jgi:outer membrane protein TolC